MLTMEPCLREDAYIMSSHIVVVTHAVVISHISIVVVAHIDDDVIRAIVVVHAHDHYGASPLLSSSLISYC